MNFGIPPPPPPPPPPPRASGRGQAPAFYQAPDIPPPPPPRHQPAAQYHQLPMQQSTAHGQGGYQYQVSHQAIPPGPHTQWCQQMNQQHYPDQYSYQTHSGYVAHARPPPPPPPRQGQHYQRGFNNGIGTEKARTDLLQTNPDATTSPSVSKSSQDNPNGSINANGRSDAAKKRRINSKMARKYAGRGLKMITVSGPGMPTQKFKICVGNHPDDVRKWIEERRRRFPRRDGSPHRMRPGRRDTPVEDKSKDGVGTSNGEEDKNEGGLSSLLAGYASASSSENEEAISKGEVTPSDPPKSSTAPDTTPPPTGDDSIFPAAADTSGRAKPMRLCRYHQRGKCRHGASCKFLHTNPISDADRQKERKEQSERDRQRNRRERELQILGLASPDNGNGRSAGRKLTHGTGLLHKLLQRDMERERRLTLQLLRYLADCDYFLGEGEGGEEPPRERSKADADQT